MKYKYSVDDFISELNETITERWHEVHDFCDDIQYLKLHLKRTAKSKTLKKKGVQLKVHIPNAYLRDVLSTWGAILPDDKYLYKCFFNSEAINKLTGLLANDKRLYNTELYNEFCMDIFNLVNYVNKQTIQDTFLTDYNKKLENYIDTGSSFINEIMCTVLRACLSD